MLSRGMNLIVAYAIGAVVGLSVTLGIVGWVADRVGSAEVEIRSLVLGPAAGGAKLLQAREAAGRAGS